MEQEFKVKSLAKAMKVLECFSNERPELGITEIADRLDLNKSTVHNIASTFESLGYLAQNAETGKYYLGVKLLQFSYIVNNHMGFRKFLLPYMKRIAAELGETVYMGIPHERDVLYIECYSAGSNAGARNILGERARMHCTGLGKAMLAYLSPARIEQYLSVPLEKYTQTTITTRERLLAEIEITRARSYAVDNMEHEHGITCIGVPIFGNDGKLVAAVSISAPSPRFGAEVIAKHAECMREILKPAQHQL